MNNEVFLIGNLGKDPEIKTYGSEGKAFVKFSLATNEWFKDKQRTDWHNVVCFNNDLALWINDNLKKGSRVILKGKIETKKSGERWYTNVRALTLGVIPKPEESESPSEEDDEVPF